MFNLPRKFRTPPIFYVGLLNLYRDSSQVDQEELAPRKLASPQAAAYESEGQVASPSVSNSFQTSKSELAPRQACAGSEPSLAKTFHLVNQSLMDCSRHTDRHWRCLANKEPPVTCGEGTLTTSSSWPIPASRTDGSTRYPLGKIAHMSWIFLSTTVRVNLRPLPHASYQ